MRRCSYIVVAIVLTAMCAEGLNGAGIAVSNTPAAANQTSAGLASPYADLLLTLVENVGAGQVDAAIGVMEKHGFRELSDEAREALRKGFSRIYGVAGDYDGAELVAVRAITPRLHDVFLTGYHEEKVVVYTIRMYAFGGEWKVKGLQYNEDTQSLEDFAPVEWLAR